MYALETQIWKRYLRTSDLPNDSLKYKHIILHIQADKVHISKYELKAWRKWWLTSETLNLKNKQTKNQPHKERISSLNLMMKYFYCGFCLAFLISTKLSHPLKMQEQSALDLKSYLQLCSYSGICLKNWVKNYLPASLWFENTTALSLLDIVMSLI